MIQRKASSKPKMVTKSELAFLLSKVVAGVICFVVFVVATWSVYVEFRDEVTNTSISFERPPDLPMPAITVCPTKPFKAPRKIGVNYDNSTFALRDIFDSKTLDALENATFWNVTRVRTFYFGQCYMLRYRKNVKAVDLIRFEVKTSVDFFIADPGEEFWLLYALFPFPITKMQVEPGTDRGSVDLHLIKRETDILKNCSSVYTDNYSFSDCSKELFRAEMIKTLNCSVQELKYLIHFLNNVGSSSCPLSCHKNGYAAYLIYMYSFRPGFFVSVYYDSLVVEKSEEYLTYDLSRLLSAVGGSLGLFLGLSCFSVFYDGISCLQRRLGRLA